MWRRDIHIVAAPNVERGLLKQKGKSDCKENLTQWIKTERAKEYSLHQHADDRDRQCGHRNGQRPRAGSPDYRKRDIAAEQEIRTMREINDAHHTENQGQAATHEKQQCAVRDAVESLNYPELRTHSPLVPSVRSKVAAKLTLGSMRMNTPNGRSLFLLRRTSAAPHYFAARFSGG